uniref:Uncharacterized protein n=1 Tax=Myripristis murdjan TaxID=586833 RepID=A0A667ZQN5_9TELE
SPPPPPPPPPLAVCLLNLQSDGDTVTDSSPHLASCCELLELILRKGLQQPVLSLIHRDYWQCFEQIPHQDTCGRLSALSLALEQTRVCRKLLTAQGRGRYLLRLALSRKALPQFIAHLLNNNLDGEISFLLPEPFMSLLLVLSQMEFKLDMQVKRLYPTCQCICTGRPCMLSVLSVCVRYLSGRVFVLDLLPGSQAQVDKFIRPGDVIDEINGISLRNSKNGQAGMVLSRLKGRPLSMRVLRWRDRDGGVYRPLIKLLRALRVENPTLQLGPASSQQSADEEQRPTPSQCLKDGRQVRCLHVSHVFVQELFQHHYPEISCVGRYGQPDYTIFAFCVADSPETPQSTGFCCVALRASTVKECEEIVCRIATGFKHTEWFV